MRCENDIVSPFSLCFYKALITFPTSLGPNKELMSYHCSIKGFQYVSKLNV